MKAGKLKKVLLPVLSLSLATMLTVMNVHATENTGSESANQKQVVAESGKEVLNDGDTINNADSLINENEEKKADSVLEKETQISDTTNATNAGIIASIEVDAIPYLPVGATIVGYITTYDAQGNKISSSIELTADMIDGFDNITLGKRQYTFTYEGFTQTLETEIVRCRLIIPDQIIPLGGEILLDGMVELVDADSSRRFGTAHISHWGFIESPWDLIDNTKAGVREIELKSEEFGVILTGTMKVTVGTPSQMAVDKLPTKAQTTMPDGSYVGTWDVPSGEAGAGTWTFQTNLAEGTEVVVWSFHNNQWLKIGVYKVDANGMVTVTFTADQLSPILITKNDGNSGSEVSNNTVSNNNSDSNVTTRTASPKTGDNASAMLFSFTALLSLALISIVVYLKQKKISV